MSNFLTITLFQGIDSEVSHHHLDSSHGHQFPSLPCNKLKKTVCFCFSQEFLISLGKHHPNA